jgi:hypothetical protein
MRIKSSGENAFTIHRNFKWFLVLIMAFLCITVGFIAGTNMTYPVAYDEGVKVGYSSALIDVANLLQRKGITLDWTNNADGSYVLTVSLPNGQIAQANIAANLVLEHRDKNGNLISVERGAGTFTTLGKNWTLAQISNIANIVQSNTGINASQAALYLADSTDMTGVSVASTILPNEITNKGMERKKSTTDAFVSTGVFTVSCVKTATDAVIPLGWGLNYAIYTDFAGASLIAYDATPGSKNMVNGDTLTETWTITIT